MRTKFGEQTTWWWCFLVVMSLLVLGCGHRATHGIHHQGKKVTKVPSGGEGKGGALASSSTVRKANARAGEGYFPTPEGNFSDLLQDEPLVFEEHQSGNARSGGEGDYWANRTQAEYLTAQSGLQDVHFEFNSYQLTEKAKQVLSLNADWIKANPDAVVTIEGHCDERGTQAYNYVLGEKRAIRTKAFLTSLGVKDEQLHTMTFGKDNPVCWDPMESCYQKNRRAHLVLGVNVASTAMQMR